jgi:prolipoprotein diacylglyceryl transferase
MMRHLPASIPASIPSPSDGTIELGPLTIHAYGMVIALGVVAGIWLFGRRLEARGAGTRDDATAVGMWGVLGGIIGARLYHVATSWDSFADDPLRIFAIWKGGLGIPGGLALGIAVGLYAAKRRGLDVPVAVTCITPGIPLAQAIGRWGNWFNQELFGGPTTLPWALEVSDDTAAKAGDVASGVGAGTRLTWQADRLRATNRPDLRLVVSGNDLTLASIDGVALPSTHTAPARAARSSARSRAW